MMMGTATPRAGGAEHVPGRRARRSRCCVIVDLTAEQRNGRRGPLAACRWKSSRTRSSASRAYPATGSASWCRCWPASAAAGGGQVLVHGESYRATPRRRSHSTSFHVLPEMPLQNACVGDMTVAENLAFRDFDRPPLTPGTVVRELAGHAQPRRRADPALSTSGRRRRRRGSAPLRRQCAAGGAGARAGRARWRC